MREGYQKIWLNLTEKCSRVSNLKLYLLWNVATISLLIKGYR